MKVPKKVLSVITGLAITIATVLVQDGEGVEYKPYKDVVGVLTVCYGHTGNDIVPGKTYTQKECDYLLLKDLSAAADQVDALVTHPIPDTTRAALYSFTYNVGVGAFSRSTLLKKLNAGDTAGACLELKRWVYAGGKKWKGLENRRDIERQVCEWGAK